MLGAIIGSRFEFNNTSDFDFELFRRDMPRHATHLPGHHSEGDELRGGAALCHCRGGR